MMSLDRRLEAFQAKVQQEIDIQDDEIARLTDYLNCIKAETLEVKDSLIRFKTQSEQDMHHRKGKRQCKKANLLAKAARMKCEHHTLIQDLEESHATKVEQMNDDFEKMLEEVSVWAEKLGNEKIKPVVSQIARVEKLLEEARNEEVEVAQRGEENTDEIDFLASTHELDSERIMRLETSLKEKNQDRLRALTSMKQQLSECVATLEDLEQAHSVKMDKLKTKLALVDTKYEQKLKSDTETHRRQMNSQKRKVADAESRTAEIQKLIDKMEKQHSVQMQEASQVNVRMRMDMRAMTRKPAASRKEVSDSLKKETEVRQMRTELEKRERILLEERENNDRLKREVSRIKDEIRIAERRAALNLL